MTPTTAADKVKEIIRSYLEFYTERGSMTTVKEWLESKEGSRLVGELVEGWVSVETELPKDTRTLIVHLNTGVVTVGWYWSGENAGWKGDIIGTVTHFQYLPKPPKT